MTTNDDDPTSQLTNAITLILEPRGTAFIPAGKATGSRGMIIWLSGSIEGHPVRFDFYAPAVVAEGTHVRGSLAHVQRTRLVTRHRRTASHLRWKSSTGRTSSAR